MASFEFWVDPVVGSNANAGTEALPYATVYYAIDSNRKANGDTVIVNVVPSGSLQSADFIRMLPQHNTATYTVRSATPGVRFTHTNSCDQFVVVFASTTATLRVEDAQVTCNKVQFHSGNATGNRSFVLQIAGTCIFTHARVFAEEAFRMIVPPSPNKLGTFKIEAGCQVNGWSRLFLFEPGALETFDVDGLIVDGTHANAGNSTISATVTKIKNCTISLPTTGQNNSISVQPQVGTLVEIENNVININTTGSFPVEIRAPLVSGLDGGSTTCNVVIRNNTITSNGGAYLLKVGRDIDPLINRTGNKDLVRNYQTCLIEKNDLMQNGGTGVLGVFVGADSAVCRQNYCRVQTLGDTTNVHQIYLHAESVLFEDNLCQASLLAFGSYHTIRNNLIIADRAILLGGTGGGSQLIGGGNNYTIRDNLLISFEDDCYSDYAFNGAYPTNLGPLVADINRNQYVVINGGLARLTNTGAGLLATTMAELRNLWQNSVLSGSGSVWGDASNAGNDSTSRLEISAKVSGIVVQSASLSRAQMQSIWSIYRGGSGAISLVPGLF